MIHAMDDNGSISKNASREMVANLGGAAAGVLSTLNNWSYGDGGLNTLNINNYVNANQNQLMLNSAIFNSNYNKNPNRFDLSLDTKFLDNKYMRKQIDVKQPDGTDMFSTYPKSKYIDEFSLREGADGGYGGLGASRKDDSTQIVRSHEGTDRNAKKDDIVLSSFYGYAINIGKGVQVNLATEDGKRTDKFVKILYTDSKLINNSDYSKLYSNDIQNELKQGEVFVNPGSVLGKATGTKHLYKDQNVPNHIHEEIIDIKNTSGLSIDNPFKYTNPNRQYNGDSTDRSNYSTSHFEIEQVYTKKGFIAINPATNPFPKIEKPKLNITLGMPKD
jgi:hypothetical protein